MVVVAAVELDMDREAILYPRTFSSLLSISTNILDLDLRSLLVLLPGVSLIVDFGQLRSLGRSSARYHGDRFATHLRFAFYV